MDVASERAPILSQTDDLVSLHVNAEFLVALRDSQDSPVLASRSVRHGLNTSMRTDEVVRIPMHEPPDFYVHVTWSQSHPDTQHTVLSSPTP